MLASPYRPNRELTIGIIGGGQLAKMLAQAAYRLGLRVAIIEHGADSPAGRMTQLEFAAGWHCADALNAFAEASDIITLENEFVSPELLDSLAQRRPVYPSPESVRRVRDKLVQKQTMAAAGIPTPAFAAVETPDDVLAFAHRHGFPVVLKSRTFGYDGYGNATLTAAEELPASWNTLQQRAHEAGMLVEEFVPLEKELAVIVARSRRGELAVYPCVETVQQDHVCRVVYAPAPIPEALRRRAQELAVACVEAIDGVGVFGIELFLRQDGVILFNEIAPRPHNSGHYTIEACYTSQFENAIRAICGLPLGSPEMFVPAAVMINLLGVRSGSGIPESVTAALRLGKGWIHLYGKHSSRPRRKMGHVTAVGATLQEAYQLAQQAADGIIW